MCIKACSRIPHTNVNSYYASPFQGHKEVDIGVWVEHDFSTALELKELTADSCGYGMDMGGPATGQADEEDILGQPLWTQQFTPVVRDHLELL